MLKQRVRALNINFLASLLFGCLSPPRKFRGFFIFMTYSEKLQNPKWQKKRLEVMQRDNFTCVCCGDKETTLNVHHLKYTGEPWEAPNETLITTCKHCHTAIESLKIDWQPQYKINKRIHPDIEGLFFLFIITESGNIFCFTDGIRIECLLKMSHKSMSEMYHDLIDFWVQTDKINLLTDKNIANGRR